MPALYLGPLWRRNVVGSREKLREDSGFKLPPWRTDPAALSPLWLLWIRCLSAGRPTDREAPTSLSSTVNTVKEREKKKLFGFSSCG